MIKPITDKKNIHLLNSIPENFIHVFADEHRLQQILINIIGNAAKFTEEGSITISAELNEKENVVVVHIEDTGIGISKENLVKIFNYFEQADGSIERQYGGSGLGLSITKKLIELHDQIIWLDSEPYKGTTFHFTLKTFDPKSDMQELGIKLEEKVANNQNVFDLTVEDIEIIEQTRKKTSKNIHTILIVDDEPINLQILINHLVLEGYTVIATSSGLEVLEKIENNEIPDMILLDVMLPRMSGYDVCKKIRDTYSLYELPILMLTARNKPEDIITGLEAGANDYLAKPVNKLELLARVSSLLSLKYSVKLNNELNIIKRDIQVAHEIHSNVLLQEIPSFPDLTIAIKYQAMEKLGGDFYDIHPLSEKQVSILVADVSGHGLPAAFICAMLKVAYSFHISQADNPAQLMQRINNTMYNYVGGQFITACYIFLDLEKRTAHQVSAGHWPALLLRNKDKHIDLHRNNGMPFGWVEDTSYSTSQFELTANDRLILYTDGIVESRDKNGKMFGEKQFHQLIRNNSDKKPEAFISSIMDEVRHWSSLKEDENFEDDVTLLIIDIENL